MEKNQVLDKISKIKDNIPTYSTDSYKPTAVQQKLGLINGKLNGTFVKIITPPNAYENVNELTDYFNEESRMKCSFNYFMTPYQYFQFYKKKIVYDLKKENKEVTAHNTREYIYEHIKECNLFKITTAAFIYHYFKATHILDFSAGWGDRLLAACGLGIGYFGIDPNTNNHKGYNEIIKYAGNGTQETYLSGAEYLPDHIIKNRIKKYGEFDLIFTSPPYFDYEVYASSLQSISSYISSSNYWLVFFLFIVIIKYLPFLKINGTFALYIQDIKNKLIVLEPIILFIKSFYPNMEFNGTISETFPILIFTKKSKTVIKPQKESETVFMKEYPLVYQLTHRMIKKELYTCYRIDTSTYIYHFDSKKVRIIDDIKENNVYYRTFFKFLSQSNYKTAITLGTKKATMVLYLSKVCYVLDKKCKFYYPKVEPSSLPVPVPIEFSKQLMDAIEKYKLEAIGIDVPITKRQLLFIENTYIKPQLDAFFLNFSNYDLSIKAMMKETILETITILNIDKKFSGTIFIPVSVTLIIEALYHVFKYAKFYVVQTTTKNYTEYYQMNRTIVEYSNYLHNEDISEQELSKIPKRINCTPNTSCKIWNAFEKHAIEGDICWLDAV